jgi:4-amino-4-deoxy-L-arabinose transferase-like glycosyltransferase
VWAVSLALLAVLFVCRLWLADGLALTDTTEARYAEIARKMVETGDWLMPQHRYGVPYFAKPPFAFWMSAVGIEMLGTSELAVRLPILLWSVLFSTCFYFWLGGLVGRARAALGTLLLGSTCLFFVASAAVMTDLILTACVGIALMAFWSRQHGGRASMELGMYVAIAIGVLTKGPLAAILTLVPIALWALLTRQVASVWNNFRWIAGGALAIGIAAPWYIAAEIYHPGFLSYFIIGEHFGRFLTPGWTGDLYGFAHDVPYGSIWLFLAIALLPWTALLIPAFVSRRTRLRAAWKARARLSLFAVLWAVVPLVLFSVSANVIWPYALPALPGAVIVGLVLIGDDPSGERRLLQLGVTAAALLIAGSVALELSSGFVAAHTKKSVIAHIDAQHGGHPVPIYYWGHQFYSAEFYSHGRAQPIDTLDEIGQVVATGQPLSLIVTARDLQALPPDLSARLAVTAEIDGAVVLELAGAALSSRVSR